MMPSNDFSNEGCSSVAVLLCLCVCVFICGVCLSVFVPHLSFCLYLGRTVFRDYVCFPGSLHLYFCMFII